MRTLRAGPSLPRPRAFTLLEVMLVIGLIMGLSGVLITGGLHLMKREPATPEDVFWKAAGAARKQALLSGREVRLWYSSAASASPAERGRVERALVARGMDGTEQRFAFDQPGDLEVDFLVGQSTGAAMLIAGQVVETQTLPYVTFYGDGTCSQFRVQIRRGGPANILTIDPWTCAPILTGNEAKS